MLKNNIKSTKFILVTQIVQKKILEIKPLKLKNNESSSSQQEEIKQKEKSTRNYQLKY